MYSASNVLKTFLTIIIRIGPKLGVKLIFNQPEAQIRFHTELVGALVCEKEI